MEPAPADITNNEDVEFTRLFQSEDRFADVSLNVQPELVSSEPTDMPRAPRVHALAAGDIGRRAVVGDALRRSQPKPLVEVILVTNRAFSAGDPPVFEKKIDKLSYWRCAVQDSKVSVKGPFSTIVEAGLKPGSSFVYVHGFDNSVETAVDAVARVGSLMPVENIICFSWPSQYWILSYKTDETTALASKGHLVSALEDITGVARTVNGRVHIFAHSLGNRLTIAALDIFTKEQKELEQHGIGCLFFVAADVAQSAYVLYLDKFASLGYNVNSYSCDSDAALALSASQYHPGSYRGGRYGPVACSTSFDKPFTTVLWQGPNVDKLAGHSYFFESKITADWINVINGTKRQLKPDNEINLETYYVNL